MDVQGSAVRHRTLASRVSAICHRDVARGAQAAPATLADTSLSCEAPLGHIEDEIKPPSERSVFLCRAHQQFATE